MYRAKKIGVIVPAYNEEKLIKKTLQGIPPFVDKIIVIDDNSKDNTKKLVEKEIKRDNRIELIIHSENRGVGGAIISGFKHGLKLNLEILAIMAGDNQMDPNYLNKLIDPIVENKADFTKGNRLKKGFHTEMPRYRYIGNKILSFLNKFATGYWNIEDPQNGYVAISSDSLKLINLDSIKKGYQFENDLMVKANIKNIRMMNVDIPARYGEEESKIKFFDFVIKTIFLLITAFIYRIWHKFIIKK
ncbi:MAG: glycosyltransferase family 2 protein [Promethearchaeota archaeon]